MSFTTTSDEVLSVRGLNLAFRLRYYGHRTLRGVFVDFLNQPGKLFFESAETLHLLKDIDLTVRRGERLGVLGVNGSGKTSLCRCIAGMLHPASGEIRVNGRCRAVFDSNVGVIPQLTGRENARLIATLLFPEQSDEGIEKIVSDATGFSELGHFLDVPFETYSLGMKARLFLSLMTAEPTNLLILDEVYDNTDRFFQSKMTRRLNRFIESADAVIFVSHSPEIIKNTCNRAIVIHQSRIAFDGPVDDAVAAYESLNGGALGTAAFISQSSGTTS